MARFYSNENFPLLAVQALRTLGHTVLTSLEANNANRCVPDEEVLNFAIAEDRILLTMNRLHFLRLHKRVDGMHSGIVICTFDPDFQRLALRIHQQVLLGEPMRGKLERVYRPGV